MPGTEQWKINRWAERQHEWKFSVVSACLAEMKLSSILQASVCQTHCALCDVYFAGKNRKPMAKKLLIEKLSDGVAARSAPLIRRHLAILQGAQLLKIEDGLVTVYTKVAQSVVVWFPAKPHGCEN